MSDEAQFSPALIGFYICCGLVSAGAGMVSLGFLVFDEPAYEPLPTVLKVVGGLFLAGGLPGAYLFLGKARR